MSVASTADPSTAAEAAEALRAAAVSGQRVRIAGNGTKLGWGNPIAPPDIELRTTSMARVIAHNEGDFTAIVEPGLPFATLQSELATKGQMLAIDPPADEATVGGVFAAADSGPLRHRFHAPRDLIIGVQLALADGSVARAGGTVIKNVAGYDLAKLFAGSFGTLGLIATVSVRLHPKPAKTATVHGSSDDPEALQRAVAALTRLPLEADCLDVSWEGGAGRVLVRYAGNTAAERARETVGRMALEAVEFTEDDGALWDAQRARQRRVDGAVLKVSGRPSDLASVLRAAGDASVASRAALGLSWLAFAPGEDLALRVLTARQALAPRHCTVLDGGGRVEQIWPDDVAGQAVMERLKSRFDPARIFRPGAFVGGI